MTVDPDQIAEIARTVWASFLGMTLRELESAEPSTIEDGDSATATIHISGGWNGSVILSCSTPMARQAAAAMFQMDADSLDDEEIADAFGELVNMIGGNLKSLLPEPSELSLPTVSLGAAHVVVPGTWLQVQTALECDGDRLHIGVWNRRDDQRHEHHPQLERTGR